MKRIIARQYSRVLLIDDEQSWSPTTIGQIFDLETNRIGIPIAVGSVLKQKSWKLVGEKLVINDDIVLHARPLSLIGTDLNSGIASLIADFIKRIKEQEADIYNKFSLQYELGCYFRTFLEGYSLQFDRSIKHFGLDKNDFQKREIDISVVNKESGQVVAVLELKFPRPGRVPEELCPALHRPHPGG